MPVLHLLRHAKAVRDDDFDDRERPLSRRGRETARLMARHLPQALGAIDVVLCSAALRTRQTMELALAGYAPAPRTLIEEALYLASDATLLRRLRRLAQGDDKVLVIGHNPGLHELALRLAQSDAPHYATLAAGKFPTLALVTFRIDGGWAGLGDNRHPILGYATPKSFGGSEA